MIDVVEGQMLIMFYKDELKKNPECLASRVMLAQNRAKLNSMNTLEG